MIRIEHSATINRPIEEVFAYATDPAHIAEWQSSALEASVDGPLQAGATGKEVRKFLGRRIESTMTIEAYEPPRPVRFSPGLMVVERTGSAPPGAC